MYQLSRLLSDQEQELYEFLESNGITPVLYLTPWFLTLFASNFPLNFAVRVLGEYLKLFQINHLQTLLLRLLHIYSQLRYWKYNLIFWF